MLVVEAGAMKASMGRYTEELKKQMKEPGKQGLAMFFLAVFDFFWICFVKYFVGNVRKKGEDQIQ